MGLVEDTQRLRGIERTSVGLPGLEAELRRDHDELCRRWQPLFHVGDHRGNFIVNGKYLVTGQTAGGYNNIEPLLNYLVAKESQGG